jgi:glycosyltransferase involved in cell wall biosynthesis
MRPRNIPSIIRVSGIHRLWWRVNDILPTREMIMQDNLEYDSLEVVEKIICPSNVIKNEILKEKNVDIDVIESPYVPCNENDDLSILNQYSLDSKKFVLFFGQVSALKGVAEIAEIINEFLEKNPDYYYVFVGQIYKYQGKPIIDFIFNKVGNFANRVIFISRLEHSKLFPIIRASQFVTLPSRIDNLPNACIESMFLGKIVIGSDGVSFEQLIEDGVSGFLCKPNDPQSILKKINEIMKLSNEEKNKISLNAQERIKKLQPKFVTNQLLNFYNSAIEIHKIRNKIL